MSGLGHGIKGGANSARAEKLAWLEDQNKQLAMLDMSLKTSLGKSANLAAKKQEFADNYTPLVATWAEAVNNNDPRAEPMFSDLVSKASQTIPGMEGLVAYRWDPVKGEGWLLNSKTKQYSKITADEIVSIIAPSAKAIYGDKWYEKFIPLNGGFAKDAEYAHNVNRQSTALELQSKQADISNKYSQANQHNAQANKTNYDMENPKKEKGTIDPKKMEQDLDVLAKQIKEIGTKGEQGGFSRTMSQITPGHIYQLTPEQTQIDTLGQLMRGQMFKAFGYRNETEFEQIPTISSNYTVEQNEAIVKQYKNLFLKSQQQGDSIENPKDNNDLSDLQ